MNIGDIVARKSYKSDIWFKIVDIIGENIILQGLYYRLIADSHISDIEIVNTREKFDSSSITNTEDRNDSSNKLFQNWYLNQTMFSDYGSESSKKKNSNDNLNLGYKKLGKILHIDGDKSYLKESLERYRKLRVPVVGVNITEEKQPEMILELLKLHKPNILVITGHDSMSREYMDSDDINKYKNSKYFVESIKIAREYNSNYDDLVIIAGGCKSNYEALMNAGANFASSPNRILIHVIDPVLIACEISTTSIKYVLDIDSVVKNTSAGINGIGGIETRGQCREGKPAF